MKSSLHGLRPKKRTGVSRGFTLVEMMVAISLLMLLMLVTVYILSAVTTIDTRTRAKVDTFREARAGFEVMTRRVSQAMLNTYWDYEFPMTGGKPDTSKPPTRYVRQSELHFISGPMRAGGASALLPTTSGMQSVTHGIFFQSPQGLSTAPSTTVSANLPNTLNASGYFVEYTSDMAQKMERGYTDRPDFLGKDTPLPAERWRFRLTEFNQGSEYLQVYRATAKIPTIKPLDWFQVPLKRPFLASNTGNPPEPINTRVLAENVIALIILPHRSPNDPVPPGAKTQLAPNYLYNSRGYVSATDDYTALSRNQLPPMVQVTMVVLDERSAERLQAALSAPDKMTNATDKLGLTGGTIVPFSKPSTIANPPAKDEKDKYLSDLQELEKKLVGLNLNYRIFSTDVSILQARWSE